MPVTPWTPAELATLLQMQMDGCSARAIGDKVGRTKNSVIGKLHRLGLCKVDRAEAGWQADKVATLKTMLYEGHSFGSIATRIAVSQSAIRSKVRREGLGQGPLDTKREGRDRRILSPRRVGGPSPILKNDEPVSLQLTIDDLKSTTCRWPHGERDSLRYCGHDAPVERAYCDYHHALAHCAGTYSERRASDATDKRIAA